MEPSNQPPEDDNILQESDFSMQGYDKHIKNARASLFVVAALILVGLVTVFPIDNLVKIISTVIIVLMAGVFIALAFWTKKKPFSAIVTGLSLYVLLLAGDALVDPTTLLQGWIIKGAILLVLISGLGNARDSQRLMEAFRKSKM